MNRRLLVYQAVFIIGWIMIPSDVGAVSMNGSFNETDINMISGDVNLPWGNSSMNYTSTEDPFNTTTFQGYFDTHTKIVGMDLVIELLIAIAVLVLFCFLALCFLVWKAYFHVTGD